MKKPVLVLILPAYKYINSSNVAASEWSTTLVSSLTDFNTCKKIYLLSPQIFGNRSGALSIQKFFNLSNTPFTNTPEFTSLSVFSINIPVIRKITNFISLCAVITWIALKYKSDNINVLTYNIYPEILAPLQFLLRINLNFELCPIILDLDNPTKDKWHHFLKLTQRCTKLIFISQWAYDNYPGTKPKHLFIGIVD